MVCDASMGRVVSAAGEPAATLAPAHLLTTGMTLTIESPLWHRNVGALIDALDKPNFWKILVRYLSDIVRFDSWVVLCFHVAQRPDVYTESPGLDGGDDELFRDYLDGFYLLDPFYLACIEDPRAGLQRLDDVAPDNFEAEEYYQRYFRLNVVKDEVEFNLPVGPGKVLALSLGATHRFTADEMAVMSTISPWLLALMRQRFRSMEMAEDHLQRERLPEEPVLPPLPGAHGLTERELEVMHLMLSGSSSKSIAIKLRISPETVKAHRRHIYSKLGVKSHPELFAILLKSRELATMAAD
jgi:DNA-binding CsgD family transcriptional regulator